MTRYDLTDEMGNLLKNTEAGRFMRYFDQILSYFDSLPPAMGFFSNSFWPSEDRNKNEYTYKPRIRIESWNEDRIDLMLCAVYAHRYVAVRYRGKPDQKGKPFYFVTVEDRTGSAPSETFCAKNQDDVICRLDIVLSGYNG